MLSWTTETTCAARELNEAHRGNGWSIEISLH
jgi:hypothetical protein